MLSDEEKLNEAFESWWSKYCSSNLSPVIDTPMNKDTAKAAFIESRRVSIEVFSDMITELEDA